MGAAKKRCAAGCWRQVRAVRRCARQMVVPSLPVLPWAPSDLLQLLAHVNLDTELASHPHLNSTSTIPNRLRLAFLPLTRILNPTSYLMQPSPEA